MKKITAVILSLAFVLGLTFSGGVLAASVAPALIDPWSNSWETDYAGPYDHTVKIEPVTDTTTVVAGNTISIHVYLDGNGNPTFDWTSTDPISAVIVKGGTMANLYEYNPAVTSDENLYAPNNPANNKTYGLSHIRFAWNEP